jgi:outer membrane murein-binding lipoprotein Lpp
MATKKTVVDSAVEAIKPPISFKEFSKDPVKGLLFIVLIAIGYLYVDGKVNFNSQIEKQGQKIEVLESKVDALTNQLRKSDSALSAAVSKITVLQELGKIK